MGIDLLHDKHVYYSLEWVASGFDLIEDLSKVEVIRESQRYIALYADEIRIERKRNFDLELIVQMKLKEIEALKIQIEMRDT